jgi:hypothetical protein
MKMKEILSKLRRLAKRENVGEFARDVEVTIRDAIRENASALKLAERVHRELASIYLKEENQDCEICQEMFLYSGDIYDNVAAIDRKLSNLLGEAQQLQYEESFEGEDISGMLDEIIEHMTKVMEYMNAIIEQSQQYDYSEQLYQVVLGAHDVMRNAKNVVSQAKTLGPVYKQYMSNAEE